MSQKLNQAFFSVITELIEIIPENLKKIFYGFKEKNIQYKLLKNCLGLLGVFLAYITI